MAYIRKRGKSYEFTVSKTINGQTQRVSKSGFRTKKEALIAASKLEALLANKLNPSSTTPQLFNRANVTLQR
ncbi:Arm DNA-binding domain-containing protein [Globicatella sulfidifaciens]|uniref:AP2-like integrase N-terminal domain-containing protein n=1 Tax=Globicatella sulfidifaciens TaxID=136093 RepID=A0A7X8GZC7_9LACT|nr:Arm DNA-binding domain-containing protein [Globicatella sulfidifaciens]NLJ17306.1 hypothetical protein [Globicatella sulfidifaciens]